MPVIRVTCPENVHTSEQKEQLAPLLIDAVMTQEQQVDLFAESTGDHQWIHTHPQRAARGPFKGTVAHSVLASSVTPMFTSEVLQIRELTMAFTYGLGKVHFRTAVPVGSLARATVSVISARQKTSGVESVFGLSYDIDGNDRPACPAEVSVLYP